METVRCGVFVAPNGGTVSYGYNSYDDLTRITRGDGQAYTMGYDAYRNLTSVNVGVQNLIKYEYKSGGNRLKTMTYANGAKQTLTYDRFGNIIGEAWNGVMKYRYLYDASNQLVKTLDISNQKMYNINRVGENITSIEEYYVGNLIVNGDIYTPTDLRPVGTMYYSFDSDGKQFRKKYIDAEGNEQKYVFEYRDEQNVAVQLPTGVVSHAKSDHLGRKVFDELQLGNGLMNRRFTYHDGVVSRAHLDNDKQVSKPETTLVKKIEFADGRTIEYEYDKEERITSVVETYTVDDTPITNTTIYTYDALGQILTETVNGEVVNSMEYDNYGNITKKNGKAYTYGDAKRKDLLTGFDGKTIEYDAQGNPTSYLGHTLTWKHGCQLNTFDNVTYSYNASSIRTRKVSNGIAHDYTLDGITILKESWGTNTIIPLYDNEDEVCGIIYNGTPFYFLKNLQGDVIAITDEFAKIVARYSYDAWGICSIDQDLTNIGIATINPYRYRSYYFDLETGLYYLQSRYYDPTTGRFLNFDSTEYLNYSGTILSHNLICYCDNNPVNATDYFGHSWFKDKIVNKVKECAQKAVKAVKETATKVVTTVKNTADKLITSTKETAKAVATTVKKVAETTAGAIAQKVTTTIVKGIAGITSVVVSNQETKTRIKNAAGHIVNTINNETARDFWNIYVIELGGTVLRELKPIATFTWESAKAAIAKCWTNKSLSGLSDDWDVYKNEVTKMLLGMTNSVTKVLDIYKKMKVEPLSLSKSNSNLKNNNFYVLNKAWNTINTNYIFDQDVSVRNLKVGEEYVDLEGNGCGLIASYNVGVKFAKNVDLPAIIYWYEQNSGIVLGGEFGINPYKIPDFLDTINLECTLYDKIDELENSKNITNGVYIVLQWNDAADITEGAHFYMVENTSSGLTAYNYSSTNSVYTKSTFAELINTGSFILAYRVYEQPKP